MKRINAVGFALLLMVGSQSQAQQPKPLDYWRVRDVRIGMRGEGKTVVEGVEMRTFEARVKGVMRDVSPGRSMILCELSGANTEKSGIVQGMSGSPIYIDGKLLGAVAFAWEFAKDPICGVTPFEEMMKYGDSATGGSPPATTSGAAGGKRPSLILNRSLDAQPELALAPPAGLDSRIHLPFSTSSFSPRAVQYLEQQFGPHGMTAATGGHIQADVEKITADLKLEPGSAIAGGLVVGDFDMCGVGTVTNVVGDRVYAFGHPFLSAGKVEMPMMTAYIYLTYPRASVSMKMGAPVKEVGVIDTDVSTCIAGRLGRKADMLPVRVNVRGTGSYVTPATYNVRIVRASSVVATLYTAVLANSLDSVGHLPEDFTARIETTIRLKGHEPIRVDDTVSGGNWNPQRMFSSSAHALSMLSHNWYGSVRVESIESTITVDPIVTLAELDSAKVVHKHVKRGESLPIEVTVSLAGGGFETVKINAPLPLDIRPGVYELKVADVGDSLRRRVKARPGMQNPNSVEEFLRTLQMEVGLKRNAIYLHLARPDVHSGLVVEGVDLPSLPESIRKALGGNPHTTTISPEEITEISLPWSVQGDERTIKFEVVEQLDTLIFRP